MYREGSIRGYYTRGGVSVGAVTADVYIVKNDDGTVTTINSGGISGGGFPGGFSAASSGEIVYLDEFLTPIGMRSDILPSEVAEILAGFSGSASLYLGTGGTIGVGRNDEGRIYFLFERGEGIDAGISGSYAIF